VVPIAKARISEEIKGTVSKIQIEIIVYDLIHLDIRKASISKCYFDIRDALVTFILRDVFIGEFDSRPLA
jgi:hypothetical protein